MAFSIASWPVAGGIRVTSHASRQQYTVTVAQSGASCDCLDNTHRGRSRMCKHLTWLVRDVLGVESAPFSLGSSYLKAWKAWPGATKRDVLAALVSKHAAHEGGRIAEGFSAHAACAPTCKAAAPGVCAHHEGVHHHARNHMAVAPKPAAPVGLPPRKTKHPRHVQPDVAGDVVAEQPITQTGARSRSSPPRKNGVRTVAKEPCSKNGVSVTAKSLHIHPTHLTKAPLLKDDVRNAAKTLHTDTIPLAKSPPNKDDMGNSAKPQHIDVSPLAKAPHRMDGVRNLAEPILIDGSPLAKSPHPKDDVGNLAEPIHIDITPLAKAARPKDGVRIMTKPGHIDMTPLAKAAALTPPPKAKNTAGTPRGVAPKPLCHRSGRPRRQAALASPQAEESAIAHSKSRAHSAPPLASPRQSQSNGTPDISRASASSSCARFATPVRCEMDHAPTSTPRTPRRRQVLLTHPQVRIRKSIHSSLSAADIHPFCISPAATPLSARLRAKSVAFVAPTTNNVSYITGANPPASPGGELPTSTPGSRHKRGRSASGNADAPPGRPATKTTRTAGRPRKPAKKQTYAARQGPISLPAPVSLEEFAKEMETYIPLSRADLYVRVLTRTISDAGDSFFQGSMDMRAYIALTSWGVMPRPPPCRCGGEHSISFGKVNNAFQVLCKCSACPEAKTTLRAVLGRDVPDLFPRRHWRFAGILDAICLFACGIPTKEVKRELKSAHGISHASTARIRKEYCMGLHEDVCRSHAGQAMGGRRSTVVVDETLISRKPKKTKMSQVRRPPEGVWLWVAVDEASGAFRLRLLPKREFARGRQPRGHEELRRCFELLDLKPGAVVVSDGWTATASQPFSEWGLRHEVVVHADGETVNMAGFSTNAAEAFFSRLKRFVRGRNGGRMMREEALKYAVSEFAFHETLDDGDRACPIPSVIRALAQNCEAGGRFGTFFLVDSEGWLSATATAPAPPTSAAGETDFSGVESGGESDDSGMTMESEMMESETGAAAEQDTSVHDASPDRAGVIYEQHRAVGPAIARGRAPKRATVSGKARRVDGPLDDAPAQQGAAGGRCCKTGKFQKALNPKAPRPPTPSAIEAQKKRTAEYRKTPHGRAAAKAAKARYRQKHAAAVKAANAARTRTGRKRSMAEIEARKRWNAHKKKETKKLTIKKRATERAQALKNTQRRLSRARGK